MTDPAPGDMVRGVRLGVDVGTVRVGVAISDPHGILATPLVTLGRSVSDGKDLEELQALVIEHEVVEVVLGLPRTLRGEQGPAAVAARSYGTELGHRIAPVPVVYVDERMTSVVANRALADRGINSRKRRQIVDQAAAVAILQSRLDGLRPGGAR